MKKEDRKFYEISPFSQRNSLYLFVVIFKEFFFFLNCHERNINKVVQNGFVTRYVLELIILLSRLEEIFLCEF